MSLVDGLIAYELCFRGAVTGYTESYVQAA